MLKTICAAFVIGTSLCDSVTECAGCIEPDLYSDVSKSWCDVEPTLRLFVEDKDIGDGELKSFQSSFSHVTREVNGVSFSSVGGEDLSERYLFCNGGDHFACNVWDAEKHVFGSSYFVEPSLELQFSKCHSTLSVDDDLLLFTDVFSDNFGHFVHDTMPGMLFLYAMRNNIGVSSDAKLLVPSNPVTNEFFRWLFRDNLDRIVFFNKNEKICFHQKNSNKKPLPGLTTMFVNTAANTFDMRNPYFSTVATDGLKNMLHTSLRSLGKCKNRYVIYVRNAVSKDMNGFAVVDSIQKMLNLHHRKEKVVMFSGEDYTIQQQYELFRCASVVVGGHGSGLGNAMWTQHSHKCLDPVHIVEVTCGPKSANVHSGGGCPYSRNYFQLTGGLPWAKYHLMTFTDNSTDTHTWIPLTTLEALLNEIFISSTLKHRSPDNEVTAFEGHKYTSLVAKGRYSKFSLSNFMTSAANELQLPEKFSLVVYAPHKSGSKFIHNYFADLSKVVHVAHFSENMHYSVDLDTAFTRNKDAHKILAPRPIMWHNKPVHMLSTPADSMLMIHWRDPRDIIISNYHSFGWSHATPSQTDPGYVHFQAVRDRIQSQTLDEYVLDNVDILNDTLTGMTHFFTHPPVPSGNILVSHYDTMVFDFPKWHNELCRFIKIPAAICDQIYSESLNSAISKDNGKTVIDMTLLSSNSSEKSEKYDSPHADGSSHQYLKLLPETQKKLNQMIGPTYFELKGLIAEYGVII